MKSESKLNWNNSASVIVRAINAFNPSPGCWFKFSESRIKIIKAKEIKITGKESLQGAPCESNDDHRIAMMAAIAGTKASGDTTIKNIECVSISFPNFFELLRGFEKK